jgi:hypothetical protein
VVSGKKENSLCSVTLYVAFGDVNNYHKEMIRFQIVPFKSSYHVIFTKLFYHKFHARACHINNKLKMQGPNGTITQSRLSRASDDKLSLSGVHVVLAAIVEIHVGVARRLGLDKPRSPSGISPLDL